MWTSSHSMVPDAELAGASFCLFSRIHHAHVPSAARMTRTKRTFFIWNSGTQEPSSRVIPIQQSPQSAQHRSLLASAATALRRGGVDAAGETAEGQRLQPHVARPAQRGEEQSFAAKQSAFDPADHLNVVIDARLKRDETARVHAQHFAWGEIT